MPSKGLPNTDKYAESIRAHKSLRKIEKSASKNLPGIDPKLNSLIDRVSVPALESNFLENLWSQKRLH